MKIMFIFDRVCHYHIPTFQALDTRLKREGHQLLLLSGEPVNEDSGRVGTKEQVIEKQYPYKFKEWFVKSFIFRRWYGVDKLVLEHQPDIIIMPSHVGNISNWRIQRLGHRLGAKLLAWQCGYEYNSSVLKDLLLTRFLKRYDHHLAYHTNAKKYVENHGVSNTAVTVIHNTIDEKLIEIEKPSVARAMIEQQIAVSQEKKIVLYVGAILEEKNIEQVFSALDRINRSDVIFLVVGDGPHLEVLKDKYQKRNDVVFLGRVVDGVGKYFDAANVFVLPGTGGLAINEAMAHSLPVISSFADGSADDLVKPDRNGYRITEDSPENIAKYLNKILDDDQLQERLGAESRRMITTDLSFDAFINRVMTVLLGYSTGQS